MKKNFKKIALAAVLAGALCFGLTACGGSTPDTTASTTADTETATSSAKGAYTFEYNGTVIALNQDMSEILPGLGDPADYFESESCAFQGMDKVYTYNSFIIRTYPSGDKDYVLSISLRDDTVSTNEGISIGSTKDDVINAYGEGEATEKSIIYTKDAEKLSFVLDGDKVTSIEYTAVK